MNRTLPFIGASMGALLLLGACTSGHDPAHDALAAEHAAMMAADSTRKAQVTAQEETLRKVFEMFNTGNTDGIEELVTADFMDHQKDPHVTTTGLQGALDMMNMLRTAFPDFHQDWVSSATNGDLTFVHYHMTGTNSGPFGPMPATGKAVDVMGVDVLRMADGKLAEHWGYMEEAKMMEQLGMMGGGAENK